MPTKTIPAVVLGSSGYVASEIIRLLINHPSFWIEGLVSTTNEGRRLEEVFPHMTGPAGEQKLVSIETLLPRLSSSRQLAVFSAMPHGQTAPILERLIATSKCDLKIVDVSADFRFGDIESDDPDTGQEMGNAKSQFFCGLPDIEHTTPDSRISHPGCFTTAVSLALAPLFKAQLIEPKVCVSAVTGSTGAGQQPRPGTHHPERQSAMWAYNPLRHRHTAEIEMLLRRFSADASVAFVPHSGPFSRGIHATIFADLNQPVAEEAIIEQFDAFYAGTPFVTTSSRMPSIKEVVGSNRCHIGIAVEGSSIVVTSVIDNLVKGAAGGAIQWMNRLFALEQGDGLQNAMPGWI